MSNFGNQGLSGVDSMAKWLARLGMFIGPILLATFEGLPREAILAIFFGVFDGWSRWWSSFTARSFVVKPAGIAFHSLFRAQFVPWENISAIQTWHHVNQIDYCAIHYFSGARLKVATCCARWQETELRELIFACARHVSQPRSIEIAGVCERSVWLGLLRRFAEDALIAALVGWAIGAMGRMMFVGLLAASFSALFVALRHPFRTTRLLQKEGLWCDGTPAGRPLRTIPRALRYWVRGLEEAAYRAAARGASPDNQSVSAHDPYSNQRVSGGVESFFDWN